MMYKQMSLFDSNNVPEWAKWLVRNKNGDLWAHSDKPHKGKPIYWITTGENLVQIIETDDTYSYITWEDEEPYEIAELIEEYESEETEVKDKVELKSWFEDDKLYSGKYVKHKINQLDEPEVLSREWIESNTSPVDDEGRLFIWKSDLQNVMVPKQELPVIPQFVAEWIETCKEFIDYDGSTINIFDSQHETDTNLPLINTATEKERAKVYDWIVDYSEKYARAWLDGYEVEEEQKYYVINNDQRMMLVRMMDGKTITEADPFKLEDMYEVEKKSHRLTEQEIKDYDERFWPFVVKVEEMEE